MSNSNNNNGGGRNEANDVTRSTLSDIERIVLGVADTVLGYVSQDPATYNNIADALQRAVASRHSHESLNNLQDILNGTSNTSATSTSANQSSTTTIEREPPPAQSTTNVLTEDSKQVQFDDTETSSAKKRRGKRDKSPMPSPSREEVTTNRSNDDVILHDFSEEDRFPQGERCYDVNDPSFNTSWCMMLYSNKPQKDVNKYYVTCVGMYKCSEEGCSYKVNPVIPRKRRKKAIPDPPKTNEGKCLVHKDTSLVHVPCKAGAILVRKKENPQTTTVNHYGIHEHQRPHEKKVPKRAKARLADIVAINNEATPSQILHGTPTREPSRDLYPSLNNLNRLTYEINKIKSGRTNKKSLKELVSWEKEQGVEFIRRARLDPDDAAIVMQFPEMVEIARSNTSYAFQTDTIENWIRDDKYPDLSVTVTSVHSDLLRRHVPVMMSITFGKDLKSTTKLISMN